MVRSPKLSQDTLLLFTTTDLRQSAKINRGLYRRLCSARGKNAMPTGRTGFTGKYSRTLPYYVAQSNTGSAAADDQAQSRQYAAAGMFGNERADLVTNDSLV